MKGKRGFQPGQVTNPKGRPTGTQNKITKEIRERIKEFIEANFDTVQEKLKQVDPDVYLGFYEKLLKYAIPPLQSLNITGQVDVSQIKEAINSKFPFSEPAENDLQSKPTPPTE